MNICHNLSRQLSCALIFMMCPDHCNQYCANVLVWQTYLAICLHSLPCSVILIPDLSPIYPICAFARTINRVGSTKLMVGRPITPTLLYATEVSECQKHQLKTNCQPMPASNRLSQCVACTRYNALYKSTGWPDQCRCDTSRVNQQRVWCQKINHQHSEVVLCCTEYRNQK